MSVERKKITFEYDGELVTNCKACGVPIFFHTTKAGKPMPVNYETKESHFADCPSASDFRAERSGRKQGRGIILKNGAGA